MFESFLTLLGTMVANKKVLGAWMIVLSAATAQIASAVYVKGGSESAVTKKEIEHLTSSVDEIKGTLKGIEQKVNELSLSVAELKVQGKNGKK